MEVLEIRLQGVAVDVFSEEWALEEVLNKSPVTLERVKKRKGGFTLEMRSPSDTVEWYFSKGLTEIKIINNGNKKSIHIEHEDGHYWVDLQYSEELIEFLKEFMEES
ncbi:hypothetical protein [Persephonella sp.]